MSTIDLSRTQQKLDAAVVARAGATTALLGSAVVHSTVITEHYAAWWLAGTFFLGLQMVETALAIALVLRWSRTTAMVVLVTSLGTVAVWLLSRTVGLPFGPEALRQPEAIGTPDLASCVLELTAALLVAPWAIGRRAKVGSSPLERRGATLPVSGLLVVALLGVTGAGLLPALTERAQTDSGHTHDVSHPHAN